jgi:3'-5' exoribonuclease
MTEKDTHLWVKDITENNKVSGFYLVKEKRAGTTRKGDPFLSLVLADRTGEVEARIWEGADELSPLFFEGDIVRVEGNSSSYRGKLQITLSNLEAPKLDVDPAVFLESTTNDFSEMMKSLRKILRKVKNAHLRSLIDRFLGDPAFVSGFEKAPAAKNFHHNYLGGLLEHTLSVCRMALNVAEHYPQLDGDLLLTGAFLHDIGKIEELKFDLNIDYSDQGRLIGHVVLGVTMLDKKLGELKEFPEDLAFRLKHLILSHHGEYEFGSPKRPKFLEAFALHLIDDLDAKISGLGRFMEKDRQEGAWTDFNRLFERYFLKGTIAPPLEEESNDGRETDRKQGTLFSS